MGSIQALSNFITEDDQSSVRLFFFRENALDRTWHITDAALGTQKDRSGLVIHYLALHGTWMPAYERADSLAECKSKTIKDTEAFFCARCLEEFDIARETIQDRRLLKFN